jgi:hypothetical protein
MAADRSHSGWKPSPETAQALVNLRASRDFSLVLGWFEQMEVSILKNLAMTEDADRRAVSAGMLRAMMTIRDGVEDAPKIVEQVKNGTP